MHRLLSQMLPIAILLVTLPLAGCGSSGGSIGSTVGLNQTTTSPNVTVSNETEPATSNNAVGVTGENTTSPSLSNSSTVGNAVNNENSTSLVSPADTSYIPYTNARFQFQLSAPSSFQMDPPPTDGDGETWESSTQNSQITAEGAYNVTGATLASMFTTATTATSGYAPGQSSEGANWYIVSGTESGANGTEGFTQKVYVGTEYTYQLTFTYPVAQTNAYQSVVQAVMASFTPGPM